MVVEFPSLLSMCWSTWMPPWPPSRPAAPAPSGAWSTAGSGTWSRTLHPLNRGIRRGRKKNEGIYCLFFCNLLCCIALQGLCKNAKDEAESFAANIMCFFLKAYFFLHTNCVQQVYGDIWRASCNKTLLNILQLCLDHYRRVFLHILKRKVQTAFTSNWKTIMVWIIKTWIGVTRMSFHLCSGNSSSSKFLSFLLACPAPSWPEDLRSRPAPHSLFLRMRRCQGRYSDDTTCRKEGKRTF